MKNKTALKGGTYSIVLTAIVLAILVVVNIFAQALPSSVTQYDISSTKLYSITSNTKVVVNALKEDVTIYWVVQNGKKTMSLKSFWINMMHYLIILKYKRRIRIFIRHLPRNIQVMRLPTTV